MCRNIESESRMKINTNKYSYLKNLLQSSKKVSVLHYFQPLVFRQ